MFPSHNLFRSLLVDPFYSERYDIRFLIFERFLRESIMISHGWSGVVMSTMGIGLVATIDHDHDDVDDYKKQNENEEEHQQDSKYTVAPYLWIGMALCCAIAYALYNISVKKGSSSFHPIIGAVILQFVGAIFGLILLGIIVLNEWGGGGGEDTSSRSSSSSISISVLNYDSSGVIWSCFAGLAVGVAELLSFGVSGMGVHATQSIPILIGGSVVFGAVLGIAYSSLVRSSTFEGRSACFYSSRVWV